MYCPLINMLHLRLHKGKCTEMGQIKMQGELRDATAARDAHREALDLAQQGLADLEAALAKEQAAREESAQKVSKICALHA